MQSPLIKCAYIALLKIPWGALGGGLSLSGEKGSHSPSFLLL